MGSNKSFLKGLDLENVTEEEAKTIWNKYDKDRSGELDKADFQKFFMDYAKAKKLKDADKKWQAIFAQFDKNQDGKISTLTRREVRETIRLNDVLKDVKETMEDSSEPTTTGSSKRILAVVSSGSELPLTNGLTFSTGVNWTEFLEPAASMMEAGYTIEVATPDGKAPPWEGYSVTDSEKKGGEEHARLTTTFEALQASWNKPAKTSDVNMKTFEGTYTALFVPGGHGAMVGIHEDKALGQMLRLCHEKNIMVITLCHGPNMLRAAALGGGEFPFKGYKLTCFPDMADKLMGANGSFMDKKDPSKTGGLLEFQGETLTKLGFEIVMKPGASKIMKEISGDEKPVPAEANGIWSNLGHVVRDRELFTGDSPFAAKALGALVKEALLGQGKEILAVGEKQEEIKKTAEARVSTTDVPHGRVFSSTDAHGGEPIDPASTALVWIEFQNEFATEKGKLHDGVKANMKTTNMLENAKEVCTEGRKLGMKVIHSPITFAEDMSDNPNKNQGILKGCNDGKLFLAGTWNAEFCEAMTPQDGDDVLKNKKGLDAFPGTNLEALLLQHKIKTVALGGFLTNCCVESTMRTAFEKGFNVVTLSDCTATTSDEGHKAATEGTFNFFSTPMKGKEFLEAAKKPAEAQKPEKSDSDKLTGYEKIAVSKKDIVLSNKDIVLKGYNAIFVDHDAETAEANLSEDYKQHNPNIPTGRAPILGLIPVMKQTGFTGKTHRVFSEGEFVVLHNSYENAQMLGAETMIAFDVFRVEGDKIVEHWDNLTPLTPANPSGRTQTDGPVAVEDISKTGGTKKVVTDFMEKVMLRGEMDLLPKYISTEQFDQHNPQIADGLKGFGEAVGDMKRTQLHRVIAEGNFALAMSQGTIEDKPTAYYDLFRVANGVIVEHWDVMSTIPEAEKFVHSNGMF